MRSGLLLLAPHLVVGALVIRAPLGAPLALAPLAPRHRAVALQTSWDPPPSSSYRFARDQVNQQASTAAGGQGRLAQARRLAEVPLLPLRQPLRLASWVTNGGAGALSDLVAALVGAGGNVGWAAVAVLTAPLWLVSAALRLLGGWLAAALAALPASAPLAASAGRQLRATRSPSGGGPGGGGGGGRFKAVTAASAAARSFINAEAAAAAEAARARAASLEEQRVRGLELARSQLLQRTTDRMEGPAGGGAAAAAGAAAAGVARLSSMRPRVSRPAEAGAEAVAAARAAQKPIQRTQPMNPLVPSGTRPGDKKPCAAGHLFWRACARRGGGRSSWPVRRFAAETRHACALLGRYAAALSTLGASGPEAEALAQEERLKAQVKRAGKRLNRGVAAPPRPAAQAAREPAPKPTPASGLKAGGTPSGGGAKSNRPLTVGNVRSKGGSPKADTEKW